MRETERQRQKQAPCKEPDVRLNPRTLVSWPEPKADAQPLSHPGAPTSSLSSCLLFQGRKALRSLYAIKQSMACLSH